VTLFDRGSNKRLRGRLGRGLRGGCKYGANTRGRLGRSRGLDDPRRQRRLCLGPDVWVRLAPVPLLTSRVLASLRATQTPAGQETPVVGHGTRSRGTSP
jgi:hypothetical protein